MASIILDSFSGRVTDLKPSERTEANVLAVLRQHPRVSVWDMSEAAWLRTMIGSLERRGLVKRDVESVGYPWILYNVVEGRSDG